MKRIVYILNKKVVGRFITDRDVSEMEVFTIANIHGWIFDNYTIQAV